MKTRNLVSILLFFPFSITIQIIAFLSRPAVYLVIPPAQAQTLPIASNLPNGSVLREVLSNPTLRRIASCESTGDPNAEPRQFNSDGSILWGNDPTTGKPIDRDAGMFQINTWVHAKEISEMHLDVLHSAEDNAIFALHLYEESGTKPWTASEHCWR